MIQLKKVAFYTLGCKLNFSETSTISKIFKDKGYIEVPFGEQADINVINSCCVTHIAERKTRQTISKVKREYPESIVVVTGCYPQVKAELVSSLNGVDIVLGTNEKFHIMDYINRYEQQKRPFSSVSGYRSLDGFLPSYSAGKRTRSFLKIQDGCDYWCSYCIVPMTRGKSRNMPIADIMDQVNQISQQGIKEVVLTGVNIGDFGKSTNETLYQLLVQLSKNTKIKRVRISSIEPNLLTDEIIALIATSDNLMPHFHIPLQSGSDRILTAMRRRYHLETFKKRVDNVKSLMPHAGIAIDLITGFPGETEADFNETVAFIERLDIFYLHVFTYSDRENTKAWDMPSKVHPKDKERRSKILHEISGKKKELFLKNQQGTLQKVLFEENKKEDNMFGFTENYIKTRTTYNQALAGKIKTVMLKEMNSSGNMEIEIK